MAIETEDRFGRVGVLMGGPSSEREISLKSGRAVYEAFSALSLDAVCLDINEDDIDKAHGKIEKEKIGVAFIALHGRFGEDGTMQRLLEEMGIPYTGSGVKASKTAFNKIAARNTFKKSGLLVPQAQVIKKDALIYNMPKEFPVVVKPVSSGSSIGLNIVEKGEDFSLALKEAFSYDEEALIEDYIEGREVTVGILDERPLSIVEIIPKRRFFDYQAKYTKGLTEYIVPANLEKKVYKNTQDAAYLAHRALGCRGFSRVDIIIDKHNQPFILEVNTIPGMTQMSLLPKAAGAEGISFSDLCLRLLSLAVKEEKRKGRPEA